MKCLPDISRTAVCFEQRIVTPDILREHVGIGYILSKAKRLCLPQAGGHIRGVSERERALCFQRLVMDMRTAGLVDALIGRHGDKEEFAVRYKETQDDAWKCRRTNSISG